MAFFNRLFKSKEQEVYRRAFAQYVIARAKGCALAEHGVTDNLAELGEFLGVRADIRKAKSDLWVFSDHLADTIERLLTGEPWTEDADRSAASIHGTE